MWIVLVLIALAVGAFLFLPQLKGKRTYVFNSALGLIAGVLPLAVEVSGYLQGLDWTQYVSAKYVPYAVLAVALIGMVLRRLTSGSAAK